MITVELDIFSGNPNPRWALSDREANDLLDRVMADRSLASPPQKVGSLGYRGFVIHVDDPRWRRVKLPSRFYVSANSVVTERVLLHSSGAERAVKDDVRQVAQDSIESTDRAWSQTWADFMAGKAAGRQRPGTGHVIGSPKPDIPEDTPPVVGDDAISIAACGPLVYSSDVNFSFWNGDFNSQYYNNCYNFASNYKSYTYAQPGRKANVQWSILDCGNYAGAIGYASAYDGHTNACWTGNQYYTALVLWPGNDYHWYRLCANGHWCHKIGGNPAHNYDSSGFWITNPQTCNRGNYTVFCSFRYFPHGWSVS
jgi:hypothetical protein